MTSPTEVYAFVELAIRRCHEHGCDDIAQQLDDAMHLGSSGMEILGAIKVTFVAQFRRLEMIVEKTPIEDAIRYVNRSYGLE
jgi:hypothetical protein